LKREAPGAVGGEVSTDVSKALSCLEQELGNGQAATGVEWLGELFMQGAAYLVALHRTLGC
jgi:hypothetical protein